MDIQECTNLIWLVHHLPNEPKVEMIDRFKTFLIRLIRKNRNKSFLWQQLNPDQKIRYKRGMFSMKEFEDACNIMFNNRLK